MLKNNLYFSNYQIHAGYTANQTYAYEFNGDIDGDPLFVNASSTPPLDKNDSTVPNLNLQPGSPAIDAGGPLAYVPISDTGSGMLLVVSNALFFEDGTWAPIGTIEADWIAVGTITNIAKIASIDYAMNAITLENSIVRNDGDSVWLYRKSDGEQVLHGSAPDVGACEFPVSTGISLPLPPTNLRISE